ncbi:hypothetical protein HOM50_00110 [bacterium]|jgi:hypothetical protein|nr:hypothetical protein [bacterium]MBT5014799.1 hypothetical protein [bacterium]
MKKTALFILLLSTLSLTGAWDQWKRNDLAVAMAANRVVDDSSSVYSSDDEEDSTVLELLCGSKRTLFEFDPHETVSLTERFKLPGQKNVAIVDFEVLGRPKSLRGLNPVSEKARKKFNSHMGRNCTRHRNVPVFGDPEEVHVRSERVAMPDASQLSLDPGLLEELQQDASNRVMPRDQLSVVAIVHTTGRRSRIDTEMQRLMNGEFIQTLWFVRAVGAGGSGLRISFPNGRGNGGPVHLMSQGKSILEQPGLEEFYFKMLKQVVDGIEGDKSSADARALLREFRLNRQFTTLKLPLGGHSYFQLNGVLEERPEAEGGGAIVNTSLEELVLVPKKETKPTVLLWAWHKLWGKA